MEQNNKWSQAALNGLLLSLVTIIYYLISTVFEPTGLLVFPIWALKFGFVIYLLYYFMKQYSSQFPTIRYGESFSYGFLLCSFSAIICASFSFISVAYLFPDKVEQTMEVMQSSMAMNSDQEDMFFKIKERLPEMMLFGTLIYCIIWGAIASSIIANYTKKTDIFASEE